MDNIELKFYHKQTDNPLVQQYFVLRNDEFRSKYHLNKFSGLQDEYDDESHILIASIGNDVIGGLRLVISDNNIGHLPLEKDSFQLRNLFPNIDLKHCKYAELTRFAIKKNSRSAELSTRFYEKIFTEKLPELNVKYAFCVTKMGLAISYRMLCKKIGINVDIRKEIKVPNFETYENLEMFLSAVDLNHLYDGKTADIQKTA